MTQRSGFFDGVSYTETTFASAMRRVLQTGVVVDSGASTNNAGEVYGDASGRQVKVRPGEAWIEGYWYSEDAEQIISITANSSGNPRRDLIVLRLSRTSNTFTLMAIAGTPAGTPTTPSPTQTTTDLYDLPLAYVMVGNGVSTINATDVVDQRLYAGNYASGTQRLGNLLANPSFENWPYGTALATATTGGVEVAEGWSIFFGGSSVLTATSDTGTTDNTPTSLKCIYTSAAASSGWAQQKLPVDIPNQFLTATVRVKASVAGMVYAQLGDDGGSTAGNANRSTDWETLTVTRAVNGHGYLNLVFQATGTVYLDNAMTVFGPTPQVYRPRPQVLQAEAKGATQIWAGGGVFTGTGTLSVTLPPNYRAYRILITGRSTRTAGVDSLILRVNGDTGANYDYTELKGGANATADVEVQGGNQMSLGTNLWPDANCPAQLVGTVEVVLPEYSNTNYWKPMLAQMTARTGTTGTHVVGHIASWWRATNAITSVQIQFLNGVFAAGTRYDSFLVI